MKIFNKDFICRVLLSFFAIFFVFLLLEISIRAFLFLQYQNSFEKVIHHQRQLSPNESVTLDDILQPSRYSSIIYELRPDMKVNFNGILVETNSHGWRNKIYSTYKDRHTIRIVTIGDSHMFGWGVPENKRYTNVLETMLNLKFSEKKWEVINTAVPGYNTYMEVETLERKTLAYKPDIVIMEYIGNDLDLPNFIMDNPSYFSLTHYYLIDFLGKRTVLISAKCELISSPMFKDLITGGMRFGGGNDLSLVPEQYRHMEGWGSFAISMSKLKKMQRKYNFDVVVCISHNYPVDIVPKIMELCNQLKFYVLFSPQKDDPISLVLSKDDKHPSVSGHKLIADNLFGFLVQQKIIEKYIKKL